MNAVVAAARAALGARFRLQGRDPGYGLDCVGLAALALRGGGFVGEIPGGYALRGGDAATVAARIDSAGLVRVDPAQPGDLLLFDSGPGQLHLAIQVPGGIVHADAMLRRVVERPGAPPWPVLAAWRVRIQTEEGADGDLGAFDRRADVRRPRRADPRRGRGPGDRP